MTRNTTPRASQGASTLTGQGSGTLVGADPGDPELRTSKALKAIQAATVLLVDGLSRNAIQLCNKQVT